MDEKKNNPQPYLTPIAIIVAGVVIAGAVILKDQVSIKFGNQTPTVAGSQTTTPPKETPEQVMIRLGREAGAGDITTCLNSGKFTANINKDTADGQKAGVNGTPTFFIGDQIVVGALPYTSTLKPNDNFKAYIDIALNGQKFTVDGQTVDMSKADLSALAPTPSDAVIGNKDAKLTITVFSDFACPYCAAAAGQSQTMGPGYEAPIPNIIKDYVNTGKVRMIFREFVLHGPLAQKAAEAAQCVNEQGKYIEMADKLFANISVWYQQQ